MAEMAEMINFHFERVVKNRYDEGKVFCFLCSTKDRFFSRMGLLQHTKAAHPGEEQNFDNLMADDMKVLLTQETQEMITQLSEFNKVAGQELFKVSSSDDNKVEYYAGSSKDACEMLLVLLDAQGVLQSHPNPGMAVTVQSCQDTVKFDCWRSLESMKKFTTIMTWKQKRHWQDDPVPALAALQLGETTTQEEAVGNDTTTITDPLLRTLNQVFGFASFRQGQREVVENVLSGKDGVVVMPTGGGKTLCFSLPAIISEGVSVLVLPTVSLCQDLFFRLKDVCSCLCVTPSLCPVDKDVLCQNIVSNSVKILLVTPESLQMSQLLLSLQKINVARMIIDEAHCLDEWGSQFRPDYLKLGQVRSGLNCQCIAFTATATVRTIDTLIRHFTMLVPFVVKQSFNRTNLYLHVVEKSSLKQSCNEICDMCLTSLADKTTIVYCSTPNECNTLCCLLVDKNVKCVSYHGNMSAFEKAENLRKWLDGEYYVIIATKSLGMGIDKSNVRAVIHLSFPSSIPEYYQQVGRGGRDGDRADCFVFFKFSDRSIHLDHILKISEPDVSRNMYNQLKEIVSLFMNCQCLFKSILKYFGEDSSILCNRCSFCLHNVIDQDVTTEARQSILLLQGIISKIKTKVTFNLLAKVMCGSKDKDVKAKQLDQLPLYNCSNLCLKEVEKVLQNLWIQNVLHENNRSLCPGEASNHALASNIKVMIHTVKL